MRYVKVESTTDGFTIDHQAYLGWLSENADSLPTGAKAFALHPEHYDFTHQWCPRGATFDRISTRETDGVTEVTLFLAAYGGAPPRFVLRYTDVTHLDFDRRSFGLRGPDLLVDEILPHDDGVGHELMFAGADITVVAKDFTAYWSGRGTRRTPRDPHAELDLDNPATHVHLMRTRPGMYFLDERFLTAATAIRWHRHLWPDEDSHGRFQDYVSTRLIGAPGPVVWEGLIIRSQVAETAPGWDLSDEQHAAARELMFDLLEEYFAEQGHVVD